MSRFEFDPSFLRKLKLLSIISKRRFHGRLMVGGRRGRIGKGMEFVDHREYCPGDDFRDIDWNIYARFERFMIRLFEEESQRLIYILTDISRSMFFGNPSKMETALQLSAAITFIASSNLDRVKVFPFGRELYPPLSPGIIKGGALSVMGYLSEMKESDDKRRSSDEGDYLRTNLERVVKGFLDIVKEKGVIFILSDFLTSTDFSKAISYLLSSKFEIAAIQILSPEELDPSFSGEITMIDSETGKTFSIRSTPLLLKRYRAKMKKNREEMELFVKRYGAFFLRISSDTPIEEVIFDTMRKGHLLG